MQCSALTKHTDMSSQRHDDRYQARGVSASKDEVHSAIATQDAGLFPKAFCKIVPDYLSGDESSCLVMHADGAGTKSSLAYLAWQEGNDINLWRGIAQDSLIMNIDDCACVGAMGPYLISNTIGRNAKRIPGAVIAEVIAGYQDVVDQLNAEGIECIMCGGETADVGDLVRTIICDSTVTTRLPRAQVIDTARIQSGDAIVSFSSTGQARWESVPNAGMGSNGLTSARHESLHKDYQQQYPETFAPEIASEFIYCGPHKINDPLPGDDSFTIGQAILSPTRTYAPLIKQLIDAIPVNDLHALIHCSGGGQSKIIGFGPGGMRFVKDNMLDTPPLFKMLQAATGQSWSEMYSVFNMGARLEAVVPEQYVQTCIDIAKACGIDAQQSGHVETNDSDKNEVQIHGEGGVHTYT